MNNEDANQPIESKENTASSQDKPSVRQLFTPDMLNAAENTDDSRSPGTQDRDTDLSEEPNSAESSSSVRELFTPDMLNNIDTADDSRSPGTQDRGFSTSDAEEET